VNRDVIKSLETQPPLGLGHIIYSTDFSDLTVITDKIAYLVCFDLRKDASEYCPVEDGTELVFGRSSGKYRRIIRALIFQICSKWISYIHYCIKPGE
jgi:hypothetical protein